MVTIEQELAPARRRRFQVRLWMAIASVVVLFALLGWYEARTSRFQAHFATRMARQMWFHVETGSTDSVYYPRSGPFDLRRGYVRLPAFKDTLLSQNYVVSAQARFSPEMLKLARAGYYPPYKEKTQAGLVIFDSQDRVFYSATYPERVYASFDSVPSMVVETLLYIENRELFSRAPMKNPAVEWDRLARASVDLVIHTILPGREMPGGSTLATQIEKYRHTMEGRTSDPKDKLIQMGSATLRSYLDGENTLETRKEIVLNFVNSVPLAGLAGYGEVNGLGDGLWAWYDADFRKINELLRSIETRPALTARTTMAPAAREAAAGGVELSTRVRGQKLERHSLDEQARAFKMMVSLFIAHRRPSTYLLGNREMLRAHTDAYLRLMARDGLISPEFRDAALTLDLVFRKRPPATASESFVERKAANAIRTRLLSLMDIEQLYDLDRVDLTAHSTLDRDTQREVTATLQNLEKKSFADSIGLHAQRLLERGDPSGVIYSFTLYEATPEGNKLRVQADNFDQPLDINEGAKLDLGSTAKLRTLVNYLMIVSDLHKEHLGKSRRELSRVRVDRRDHIRRWAIDYLLSASDMSLEAMLEAAMERRYSASPGESFFTGSGAHTFVNFDSNHNGRIMSVREATHFSVNLVYIRLMRDITNYYMAEIPEFSSDLFDDRNHPARERYLKRFADKEGRQYLAKFWPKYRGKSPEQALEQIVSGIRPTPTRLAVIFRSVKPDASLSEFHRFVVRHMGPESTSRAIVSAYESYPKTRFNLQDRGYVARVHPLELWIVEYLQENRKAAWTDLVANSEEERQEVYGWLFKTRYKESQNSRIRTLLEEEAFQKIHKAWKKQGYPFSSLVPSYATSIGSSADRPAALAELMGIIQNDGVRFPSSRIESLHFARGTPYEVMFGRKPAEGERVFAPEVARIVRQTLIDVVERGTAVRARNIFKLEDGTYVPVGGKTGTGDHRFETFGRGGHLLESRVVNRTATFVFLIGDRYFGTLVAYVAGEKAGTYGFTSSLPVQILKTLSPALKPLVAHETGIAARATESPAPESVE